jgi:citrate synthase
MDSFIKNKFNKLLEYGSIEQDLYEKYDVKRGLRNSNGTGVLVGLTKVADVEGYTMDGNKRVDSLGKLYYRGIEIKDFVKNSCGFSYEKTCFLLLFGYLPNEQELAEFKNILADNYQLPNGFLENIILKNPSKSLMNHITRCILSLYSFDEDPDSIEPLEFIKKGISIVSKMPAIISYSLQAKTHYLDNDDLHIHSPKKEYSFAENILYLSRNNGMFTKLEAETLAMALIVHADHGGGSNSAFVGTVVASTLTDIYSMVAASLTSLKGPRHGGANMAVLDMMASVSNEIGYDATDDEIYNICVKLLNKEFFDNKGLIYGIGHAIYSLSDPRCELLKTKAYELAENVNPKKYEFYTRFEQIAIKALEDKKGMKCCANVDFYSGLVYEMLDIPRDLFIPIFAAARVVGWIAHDIETLLYSNKIVRPATKYVGEKGE